MDIVGIYTLVTTKPNQIKFGSRIYVLLAVAASSVAMSLGTARSDRGRGGGLQEL